MWKRDQAPKPESAGAPPTPVTPTEASKPTPQPVATAAKPAATPATASTIGRSVVIKGELTGTEDLTIEGTVEGTVKLNGNKLTVGPDGQVQADISAKMVAVLGQVTGDITATDKISILANGSVDGDLAAPSVAIADGAHFRGSVDMQRKAGGAAREANSKSVPAVSKPNGQAGQASAAAH